MAHQIGNIIGIETARVEIGQYNGRMGCMSYLLNKPNEAIVEGATFITGKHPDYNLELMKELSTGRYYCLDHLLEISDSPQVLEKWIQMMVFDFLIGNTDRHQNNWAILISYADNSKNYLKGRVSPLYDNGSSLCCYENKRTIGGFLGKDYNRFEALTERKSLSMIRIDGMIKKRPTHSEVVKMLLKKYHITKEICSNIIIKMTDDTIDTLLCRYKELLSDDKIELITRFLNRKIELLRLMMEN